MVDQSTDSALALLRQQAEIQLTELSDTQASILTWTEIRALSDTSEVRETLLKQQLLSEDFSAAAQLLEEICAHLAPEELKPRVMALVELYGKLDDSARVIETLEKVLAMDRGDAEVREALRQNYVAVENYKAVSDLLLEDAETESEVVEKVSLWRQAAELLSQNVGDTEAAAEVLQKASELLPEDRELLLELCDAYSASSRGEEATATLAKLIESYGGKRDKALALLYSRLANAQLSLGDKASAVESLDKAMSMDSSNSAFRKQAAELAFEQDELEVAQKHFKALLMQKFTPDGPITKAMVFCRLGQIQQALGQASKAKQYYERSLKEEPTLAPAQAGLASL